MTGPMRRVLWQRCFEVLLHPEMTLAELSDLYYTAGYRVSLKVTPKRPVVGALCQQTLTL